MLLLFSHNKNTILEYFKLEFSIQVSPFSYLIKKPVVIFCENNKLSDALLDFISEYGRNSTYFILDPILISFLTGLFVLLLILESLNI